MCRNIILFFILIANSYCDALTSNDKNAGVALLKLVHRALEPLKDKSKAMDHRQHNQPGYGLLDVYNHESNSDNMDNYNPYLSAIHFNPQSSYINRNPQTVRDVLETMAMNDKLRCVPRLLCEITSGYMTNNGQTSADPFRVDFGSFRQVLSSLDNVLSVSPIITFGSAVLVGMTSKGDDEECVKSYPNCPTNADDLIYYLNNYNGGFFRYFNGFRAEQYPDYGQFDAGDIPSRFDGKRANAEGRVLTKPYVESYGTNVKFPRENRYQISPYQINQFGTSNTLIFPDYGVSDPDLFKGSYSRKRKGFTFPADDDHEPVYKKPFINYYPADPAAFPDRTGTGELIIDADEFQH